MATFPELVFQCPIKWDEMRGDERERFCAKCNRTVVNLSRLTKAKRVALLASTKPEDLCVAYYQRLSGGSTGSRRPEHKRSTRPPLRWGAAAAFVTTLAVVANVASQQSPADADPREAIADAYYTFRYKADELIDDVRVYFGGTPSRAMVAGRICEPSTPTSYVPVADLVHVELDPSDESPPATSTK